MIEISNYKIVQTEGCLPNIFMPDGKLYYIGNIADFCDEQFAGEKLNNTKVPVFLGAGLFYEVLYFMQKYAPIHKSQAIIIIEKDLELFQCAMNTTDLRPIIANPNIHLFVGIPIQHL